MRRGADGACAVGWPPHAAATSSKSQVPERRVRVLRDRGCSVTLRGLGGTAQQRLGALAVGTGPPHEGETQQVIRIRLPDRRAQALVLGGRGVEVRLGVVVAAQDERQAAEVAECIRLPDTRSGRSPWAAR